MSYAVVRGEPLAPQLYLDGVLDEILEAKGIQPDAQERSKVNLPQILYHCLRKNPSDTFMLFGPSSEKMTNEQLLKLSVPLARSLISKGMKGENVIMVMSNHQQMIALYFALIFAGVVPILLEPHCTTVYEFTHYINLVEPLMVFCDEEHRENLSKSLENCPGVCPDVVVAETEAALEQLAAGHSDDLNSFQVSDASIDSTAMYLPTSGSTGMPKAALISQRGLVVQLPSFWLYNSQFPRPTELVMLMTNIQWVTFTLMVTTCVVYHVPVLVSPKRKTAELVVELLVKFRPTWTFSGTAAACSLMPLVSAEHLASLKTLIVMGSSPTFELMAAFRLVDDDGREVGLCQKGELYVKGAANITGYYKDEAAFNENFTDGWYKTGDIFYIDEKERLTYIMRKKFTFKYKGYPVSPEEIEKVICSVPGVEESVVCNTEGGPAAAIILHPNTAVSREQIHEAVNSMLSTYKRLDAGIAFVQALPRTASGKAKRAECLKLITELIKTGQCF